MNKYILLLLISFVGFGCVNIPKWNGKIYAGRSEVASIVRTQENESISCSDIKFDNYLCMSGEDFQTFYETYVLGCKQWRSGIPKMSIEDLKQYSAYIKNENSN